MAQKFAPDNLLRSALHGDTQYRPPRPYRSGKDSWRQSVGTVPDK
jgi:hypothetical protein